MLGIVALNKLFSTDGFMYVSSAMVFALGVHMGREKDRVIRLLRGDSAGAMPLFCCK